MSYYYNMYSEKEYNEMLNRLILLSNDDSKEKKENDSNKSK